MKVPFRSYYRRVLLLFSIVSFLLLMILPLPAAAVKVIPGGIIQQIEGNVAEGRGVLYPLKGLQQGDIIYAYMQNTGGNLDPMLGVLKQGSDRNVLRADIDNLLSDNELNPIEAARQFADRHFLKWDDDGGEGYDAKLKFTIPADGTYYLLAGSMVTNQSIYSFRPGWTTGSFHLQLGLNTPTGEETTVASKPLRIASEGGGYAIANTSSQQAHLQLSENKNLTFYYLVKLQPGDSFYCRVLSNNGAQLPRVYLADHGGKPIVFANNDSDSSAATLSYKSQKGDDGLILFIDGSSLGPLKEQRDYDLTVGKNRPEILSGYSETNGLPVLRANSNVTIGLSVDQIVNVNQQDETFAVVASLQLIWYEPKLAYSPDKCNCGIKKLKLGALRALAANDNFPIPEFTIYNQQGNRWAQNQIVFVEPSGRTIYRERFTVTLQAPDFDFRTYPFDQQLFKVRVDLNVPTEVFTFSEIANPKPPLGEELGEEEWTVLQYHKTIKEIPFNQQLKKSRFTMIMEVGRHLNFYVFRIFMPLFLIITISWVIFFLKDYGRQLEVASGNLLIFVAFNFAVSNDLPRLGYLTLLDRIIITSFACAALVVLISVYQKRLETKGKVALATHIDKVVLTFYPLAYVSMIVLEYFIFGR